MKNNFMDFFDDLEDPRVQGRVLHPARNILFMTIAVMFCGFRTWEEIAEIAKMRRSFFAKYLDLSSGIPSPDTFARFFQIIDPKSFGKCFTEWASFLLKGIVPEGVMKTYSIDGKTIRTASKMNPGNPLHIVSAWAGEARLVIGQVKVKEKSNEITAIPLLLELLDLRNSVVTIDAMGTQTAIAERIIGKKGDYVLALKANQPTLLQEVKHVFQRLPAADTRETVDCGHGRVETRKYQYINDLSLISEAPKWRGLAGVIMVSRHSFNKRTKKESCETSYYITSLRDPGIAADTIRKHWGVESMHWQLDVLMGEDSSLKRAKNSAENMNIIRKTLLNMLKTSDYPTLKKKPTLKSRMAQAIFEEGFLDDLMGRF